MKPFSALYFIRENRLRCGMLVFLFMLTHFVYLGGLYVTNIGTMFDYSIEAMDQFAMIVGMGTDSDLTDLNRVKEQMLEDERITVLEQGVRGTLNTTSIMVFSCQYPTFVFTSVEDFKVYCSYMGIHCDGSGLKEGSLIASQMYADNRGMELGDRLKEEEDETVYGEYTLDAVTDEDGYFAYFINSGTNKIFLALPTGMPLEEFHAYTKQLGETYDILVCDGAYLSDRIGGQLRGFYYIYFFIVVLLSITLAVTINAAFVGMYQHRQPEFAVYRVVGIRKGRLVGKIVAELLWMDLIGMVVGGAVLMTGVYLLNHLYLIPRGLRLLYYHPLSLAGMVLGNVLVLVPLVVTRSRQLLRADICAY